MVGKVFRDKDGQALRLSPETEEHIRTKHGIADPAAFIADALSHPTVILRSKWEADTRIYFAQVGHLYKAVIVSWAQQRIKTAHLMKTPQEGDTVWHT